MDTSILEISINDYLRNLPTARTCILLLLRDFSPVLSIPPFSFVPQFALFLWILVLSLNLAQFLMYALQPRYL